MEPLGAVASSITLFEVVAKVHRFSRKVKSAQEDWERYCETLHTLACISNTLDVLLLRFPSLHDLAVSLDGKETRVSLVKHVQTVLGKITQNAQTLLKRYEDLSTSLEKDRSFLSWLKNKIGFSKSVKAVSFAYEHETIISQINCVEEAHRNLHMVLTMASLNMSTSWQSEAQNLLDNIKTDIEEHNDLLNRHFQDEKLRPWELGIVCTDDSDRDEVPSSPAQDSSQRELWLKRKFRDWIHVRRDEGSKNSERQSIRREEASPSEAFPSEPSHRRAQGTLPQQDSTPGTTATTLLHTTLEETTRSGGSVLQDLDTESQGTCVLTAAKQEYTIIRSNKKLFQVPVDSQEYRSAAGPENHDVFETDPSTSTRIEDVVDSLSESEWDDTKNLSFEEYMDFLTSAQSTAYPTDVETETHNSYLPLIVSSNRESHILIAHGVNLTFCRVEGGSEARKFCIERVSIADNIQVLCVIVPCSSQQSSPCKHMTIQIENGSICLAEKLPCRIRLNSFFVQECSTTDSGSNQSSGSVASFACVRRKKGDRGLCRRHTVFDQDDRAECAMQAELFGFFQDPDDESDGGTERVPTEDLPPSTTQELYILREMMSRYGTKQPKGEMKLRILVRFLLLMDTGGLNAVDEFLSEAKRWVSLLHPSQTFDENAVPWLWVMWKLHMQSEFKQLSSIVQQEARASISQWQDGPDNHFGIRLPGWILDQLDGKRLQILSKISNRMASEIREHQKEYIYAIEGGHRPWSSRGAWFNLKSDHRQLNVVDFSGVNFADLKESIISMQELGDWKVCTVPPADLMPTALAMLTAFVPVVGVGLHNVGLHARLGAGFKAELLSLISETEKEGWGIELAHID